MKIYRPASLFWWVCRLWPVILIRHMCHLWPTSLIWHMCHLSLSLLFLIAFLLVQMMTMRMTILFHLLKNFFFSTTSKMGPLYSGCSRFSCKWPYRSTPYTFSVQKSLFLTGSSSRKSWSRYLWRSFQSSILGWSYEWIILFLIGKRYLGSCSSSKGKKNC